MKDYSLNDDDYKEYILSYKIDDKKIIATLANGELYTLPYTEENEKEIIKKMEVQVRRAKIKPLKNIDKVLSVINPLLLPLAIINLIKNGGWFNTTILIGIIDGTIRYPIRVIKNKLKKKDLRKLNYFLDHKKELNEKVEKIKDIKQGISKRAIKQIKSEHNKEKQPVTINNIDNYSLKDLKTIREYIINSTPLNLKEKTDNSNQKNNNKVLKKTLSKIINK